MSNSEVSDIEDVKQPSPKQPRGAKANASAGTDAGAGRRMVTIHPGAEADGTAPVKVGVNGNLFLIPRGVPCALPEAAISVLRDAVITEWRDNGDGNLVRNDRQRFSFTIEG